MKAHRRLLPILLLSTTALAHAQLYKWVGPDGKVTYSDTPPVSAAKKVESKAASSSGSVATAGLPFEVAEAARNNPVTLFTSPSCGPCDEARSFLNARGIPFMEKTVSTSEDLALLSEAGGDSQLPFILVGRTRHKGFSPTAWGSTLTAAGYPETSKLPKNYRNPPPQAAAPAKPADNPVQKVSAQQPQAPARPEDVPPATGNAPPGFRF